MGGRRPTGDGTGSDSEGPRTTHDGGGLGTASASGDDGSAPAGRFTTTDRSPGHGGTARTRVRWRKTLAQLRRDRSAFAGLVIVLVVVGVATFAFVDAVVFDYLGSLGLFSTLGVEQYWIAKTVWTSPTAETTAELLPPVGVETQFGAGRLAHPLGTDARGRDVLLRLIYGSRIAVQVGVVSAAFGVIGGSAVGAVAGYYGGWVDDVAMRAVEILYAIPFLILVLAVLSVLQARTNILFVTLAVGLVNVPEFARLIRSRVLTVREAGYVEAARAAGLSSSAIIRRHVVPNSLAPVVVQGTLRVGTAILVVAGLAFLGFGVSEPTPSWGAMLSSSRTVMLQNVWLSIWPGLAILVTVLGFNLLGDGLRDVLDPRLENDP